MKTRNILIFNVEECTPKCEWHEHPGNPSFAYIWSVRSYILAATKALKSGFSIVTYLGKPTKCFHKNKPTYWSTHYYLNLKSRILLFQGKYGCVSRASKKQKYFPDTNQGCKYAVSASVFRPKKNTIKFGDNISICYTQIEILLKFFLAYFRSHKSWKDIIKCIAQL